MTISRLLRIIRQRLRSFFLKSRVDAELDREFAFHLEQLIRENIADGKTPAEARRAAKIALGNVGVLQEECRDQRRVGWLHDLLQDMSYAWRMLRKAPGFTTVAIASLALGIGANTAILGVVDNVFFAELPLPAAERLVVIRTFPVQSPTQNQSASVPDYFAWKEQSRSFEVMGASLNQQMDFGTEENGAPPERIAGQGFTSSVFATLGVPPMLGRVFDESEDDVEKAAPVVVLSHRLWQRRFAGDPDILQKEVRLNSRQFSVIGVMPEGFHYPNEDVDYWIPLSLNRFQLQGSMRYFLVTARLKDGTTILQAQAELDSIAAKLAEEFPERLRGWGIRVQTVRDFRFGWTKQPLVTLEGAVVLVMMIACANLATLLMARGSARKSEFAMRTALGAGRGRIVRQLLAESMLLSLIGGAAGLFVAWFGLSALGLMMPPPGSFRIAEVAMNFRLVGITLVSSLLTGLIFGLAPALGVSSSGYASSGGGMRSSARGLRGVLVAGQVALALVLLIGSGLLLNSFIRLVGRELNFDPRGLLSFEFRLPQQVYQRAVDTFRGFPVVEVNPPSSIMQRVYERLLVLPGAESVAGISFQPINSLVLPNLNILLEDRHSLEGEQHKASAVYFLVTPNFFATMKTPLVGGRELDARDTASTPWVAVVNETAARRFWPGEDPLEKRFMLDVVSGERSRSVVGVVRNVPLRTVSTEEHAVIYVSYLQQPETYRGPLGNMFGQMTFLIRTAGDPSELVSSARVAVAEIDSDRPIANVQASRRYMAGAIRDRGYYALMIGVFAFTATLLAAIGVYGVMAYSVAQRTREIGIRIALGANVRDVIYLVGKRALFLIASGLALGLAGSIALTRLISAQLWGVTPTDPMTFAGVTLVLMFAALLACLIPARRAIRVNPTDALRSQ
jgi:predicted permease